MPKKSHDEALAELKRKQEALKNQIASIEARKRKDEDRLMTRKKILIGAYILDKHNNDTNQLGSLINELDKFLVRPGDRKLFGLPVKNETNQES